MYKFLALIMLILGSCTIFPSPVEVISSTGLEGPPQFIYFVSSDIGYSFSDVQIWNENSTQPIESCSVFKTIDGGRSWHELYNIPKASFFPIYTVSGQDIYIVCSLSEGYRIIKWNVSKDSITAQSGNIPAITCLWSQDSSLYYTSSPEPHILCSMSLDLKHERCINTMNGYISGCASNAIGTLCIFVHNKGKVDLAVFDGTKISSIINIPHFSPKEIVSYNDETMLIIGNDCDNQKAMAVSLNMSTNKFEIYNFDNYSYIKDLIKYGNRCVCLLGNESGLFVEYSLGCLDDINSSWHIIRLKNDLLCSPISLTNDRCYLYGDRNMFQQVLLSKMPDQ